MVGVGSCAGCPLAGPWGGRLGPGGCYQAACRAELWFPAVAGGGGRCGTGGVVSLLLTPPGAGRVAGTPQTWDGALEWTKVLLMVF